MDFLDILALFGGVGLFLYGMSLMGSSLQNLAGSGLEKILERLTTGRSKAGGALKGFGLGIGVTAIIQSSAATAVMLIGFVGVGIMKLTQAVPVVLGANIGSTVTAQILRLGDVSGDNLVLQLVKPASFAPMLVGIGAVFKLFSKKKRVKDVAGILIGLGLLFYGMTAMEETFAPLKESPQFTRLFLSFSHPALGVLIGLAVTALIQSSSASVGILQALSATGAVSFATAMPIIVGANLGKCATVLLSAVGGNKKAKRLAISYLLCNLLGALVVMALVYAWQGLFSLPFFGDAVGRGEIANLHLAFNVIAAGISLPLTTPLVAFTGRLIGRDASDADDVEFEKLSDLLLNTPTTALNQTKQLIARMRERILANLALASGLISAYDEGSFAKMEENERFIDRCETVLSAYILRIDQRRLSRDDRRVVSELLNSVSDLERIGDYSMNIAYSAREMDENGVSFSAAGQLEQETIRAAAEDAVHTAFAAFAEDSVPEALKVEPLADVTDRLKEIIRRNHIARLQRGECSVEAGVALNDLSNSYERIAAHAANISLHVIKRTGARHGFDDMHGHAADLGPEAARALTEQYTQQYLTPVLARAFAGRDDHAND